MTESLTTSVADMGMGRTERLLTLRTFPGYAGMSTEDLAIVAAHTRERTFSAGERLYRQGEMVSRMQFVVDGSVALRRDGKLIRRLGDKSVLGGLPAFAREPYRYDVIAERDTRTLEQPFVQTMEILEDNFNLLRGLMRGMSKQVLKARLQLGTAAGFNNEIKPQPDYPDRPLDLVERMWMLRSTMTFMQSYTDAIADMAKEAAEIRVPSGERLWREGQRQEWAMILVAGVAECESSHANQRFKFGPGDGMGFLDATAFEPRWYSARVLEDLVALRIEIDSILDVFEDHFDMARNMIAGQARVIMRLYEEVAGDGPSADPSPDPSPDPSAD